MKKQIIMVGITLAICLLSNTTLHASELTPTETRQAWGALLLCVLPATVLIIVALEYLDVFLFGREDVLFSTEENESK